MSLEPANDNTAVGSVRRFADDRSVTLHIDGSRNALFGAAMFACVPVACLILAAALFFAALNDFGGGAISTLTLACLVIGGLGITAFPALAVTPFIRQLVRTALCRVTFDADVAQLRLLAFGYGPPVCLTWRREMIRDILVHTRGAGLYELRIVLTRQPPVSLLYGVRREELDFIAGELHRALRVDARVRSVAAWWGDQPGGIAAAVKSSAAAHPAALLDYAPEPKEHGAAERSAFRARVFIPPPSVGDLIRRRKWSLVTTCVALAIIIPVQLLVVRQSSRATLLMYIGILVLLDLVAFLECVRYRSVEVDAARVTVTTRLPLLGEKVRSWPAETVADIAAQGKNLELHLRDGTRRTLVTLATSAAAENVARSLRPTPSDA